MADNIRKAAQSKGLGDYQTVELAVAFVQSLPYTTDLVSEGYDEYPRYPVETLVDNGGDCEDTSILMASLIRAMGYGVVLLRFSDPAKGTGHMAVGVAGAENMPGTSWTYQGREYYYLETTGSGWRIGQVPEEYKSSPATILDMAPVPIIDHNWTSRRNSLYATVNVEVSNLGSADANGAYVVVGFDAGNNMLWNRAISDSFDLGVNGKMMVTINSAVPPGKWTRIVVQVIYEGYTVSESHSDWFDTQLR